ncbi:MAG: phosphoglycerate dehydrogenase [Candidatus Rokubacteria bacterium]|nr:phosphoglycerate dehydrogenase [Candidatus Rokubacteria bacterium]
MSEGMLRVAFAGTFAARLAEPVRAHLGIPCDLIVGDESEIVSRLSEVDVLVALAFTREMGEAARRLKLVQVPGAGLDRIDRSALPRGTWLANAYGHEVGIAEYLLGAILTLTRGFARLDAALRRGTWESQWAVGVPPPPPWPELAGKTFGILGYGRIGRCVARRAHAFDMTVLGIRRNASQPDPNGVLVRGPDALDDVLTRADYLAITLPLTLETRGFLGEPGLRLMKPTAILVNVSRAEIVEEDALYEALVERRIGGAALDVWYRYPSGPGPTPPARRAFHELPNVLMTPHVSGWTEGMLEARAKLIAENIRRTAEGEAPVNLIPSRE